MQHIELADVLDEIRNELTRADERARQSPGGGVMVFEDCEIEFAVTLERKGDAGLKLYVINLGLGAKHSDSNKVKIKFKALPGRAMQAESHIEGEGPAIPRQQ